MNIVETNIPDVTTENIDKAKLDLADRVIESVYPIIDEIYNDKLSRVKELGGELRSKKREVLEAKTNLETMMNDFGRKKKVKKLTERISRLISAGLVHHGGLRNETIILLKVVENLTDDKIDYHLSETMKMISKRFTNS